MTTGIRTKRDKPTKDLAVGERRIEWKGEVKYLGVLVGKKLTWKRYMKTTAYKITLYTR